MSFLAATMSIPQETPFELYERELLSVPYQSPEQHCDLMLFDYMYQEPQQQSLPEPEYSFRADSD